jgi:hypothetical protein
MPSLPSIAILFSLAALVGPSHCAGEVFDSSAFYWFWLTVLAFVLSLPTYNFVKEVRTGAKDESGPAVRKRRALLPMSSLDMSQRVFGESKSVRERARVLAARQRKMAFFTFKNVLLGVGWLVMLITLARMPEYISKEVLSFDPYIILEIEKGAELPAIRKAYKAMSLKYHPDKNQGNAEAGNKFVLIAKAYETLTDETSRQNWEKYGNPDGFQGTAIVVGLPSWLTSKGNETRVLVGYLIFFVLIPPCLLLWWWHNRSLVNDSGILIETQGNYFHHLIDTGNIPVLIEMLCLAGEFREVLAVIEPNKKVFWQFASGFREEHPTLQKPRFNLGPQTLHIFAGSVLLHAHLNRTPLPACLISARDKAVECAFRVIDNMVGLSLHQDAQRRPYSLTAYSTVLLCQHLAQATFPHQSALLQLPYFTEDDIEASRRRRINTVADYRKLTDLEKRSIFRSMDPDNFERIDIAASMINGVDVALHLENKCADEEDFKGSFDKGGEQGAAAASTSAAAAAATTTTTTTTTLPTTKVQAIELNRKGQELRIYEGDVLSLKIELSVPGTPPPTEEELAAEEAASSGTKRVKKGRFFSSEVEEDKPAVVAYTPLLPLVKQERWYIFLRTSNHQVILCKIVASPRKPREVVSIDFAAPSKGTHELNVLVMSDSYMGLDVERNFAFTVKKNRTEFLTEAEERIKAAKAAKLEARRLRKQAGDAPDSDAPAVPEGVAGTSGGDGASKSKKAKRPKGMEDDPLLSSASSDAGSEGMDSDEDSEGLYDEIREREVETTGSDGAGAFEILGYIGAFLVVTTTAISYLQSQGYLTGVTEMVTNAFGFGKTDKNSTSDSTTNDNN